MPVDAVAVESHPTVRLTNAALGLAADIDGGIAPLIAALWQLGIPTRWCCQGNAGPTTMDDAYITFPAACVDRVIEVLGETLRGDRDYIRTDTGHVSAEQFPELLHRSFPPRVVVTSIPEVRLELSAHWLDGPVCTQITVRFPSRLIDQLTAAAERASHGR